MLATQHLLYFSSTIASLSCGPRVIGYYMYQTFFIILRSNALLDVRYERSQDLPYNPERQAR